MHRCFWSRASRSRGWRPVEVGHRKTKLYRRHVYFIVSCAGRALHKNVFVDKDGGAVLRGRLLGNAGVYQFSLKAQTSISQCHVGILGRRLVTPSFGSNASGRYRLLPWFSCFFGVSALAPHTCHLFFVCLLYTSPSPRDRTRSRMPSSA